MSIVDDYFNAERVFLSHFPNTHMEIFGFSDSTEYYWSVSNGSIFFSEDYPQDADNDWTYSEDTARGAPVRGSDFTLVSVHGCTGYDFTMILDNSKEVE